MCTRRALSIEFGVGQRHKKLPHFFQIEEKFFLFCLGAFFSVRFLEILKMSISKIRSMHRKHNDRKNNLKLTQYFAKVCTEVNKRR